MTELSAYILWQTNLRVGMPDHTPRSLDHRIREHAIYGTLSATVAFSALSPPKYCWFAELACIADQLCMHTPIRSIVALEHAALIICSLLICLAHVDLTCKRHDPQAEEMLDSLRFMVSQWQAYAYQNVSSFTVRPEQEDVGHTAQLSHLRSGRKVNWM